VAGNRDSGIETYLTAAAFSPASLRLPL